MVWYALTQHRTQSGLICDRASRPLRPRPPGYEPIKTGPIRAPYSYLAGIPSWMLRGCICNGGCGPIHNLDSHRCPMVAKNVGQQENVEEGPSRADDEPKVVVQECEVRIGNIFLNAI